MNAFISRKGALWEISAWSHHQIGLNYAASVLLLHDFKELQKFIIVKLDEMADKLALPETWTSEVQIWIDLSTCINRYIKALMHQVSRVEA